MQETRADPLPSCLLKLVLATTAPIIIMKKFKFPIMGACKQNLLDIKFPKLGIFIEMRLLGKNKLQELLCTDDCVNKWVCAWVTELANANWKEATDVIHQFPKARKSKSGVFIFPIGSCKKRVCIQISFQKGIAVITDIY